MSEPISLTLHYLLLLKACLKAEGERAVDILTWSQRVLDLAAEGKPLAVGTVWSLTRRLDVWDAERTAPKGGA